MLQQDAGTFFKSTSGLHFTTHPSSHATPDHINPNAPCRDMNDLPTLSTSASTPPGPQHPSIHADAVAAAAAALTQRFDRYLPRQRRRQVDAHQIHILMQQHVVDAVGVEGHVHLLGQLLRLLLRPAPQRLDGEALVLQQRDDDPGGQAGAEHTDSRKHGSGLCDQSGLSLGFLFVLFCLKPQQAGPLPLQQQQRRRWRLNGREAAAGAVRLAIHLQSDTRCAAALSRRLCSAIGHSRRRPLCLN